MIERILSSVLIKALQWLWSISVKKIKKNREKAKQGQIDEQNAKEYMEAIKKNQRRKRALDLLNGD